MFSGLYIFLVNKHPGINTRYHKMHDGSTGTKKLLSWAYLLWLNFAYYVLFLHFLGKKRNTEIYEEKVIETKQSETEKFTSSIMPIEQYISEAINYDVISFDIFDTLIFRPVSIPTDMFHLMAVNLGISNFSDLRANAESEARMNHYNRVGNTEVNLYEIWDELEKKIGISAEDGMQIEQSMELDLCYANPFMKQVWDALIKCGKSIVITSDMYLPKKCIEAILQKNGYSGYKKLYLSNEYQKSKADGTLYSELLSNFPGKSILHIGDNVRSDYEMAQNAGVEAINYPNVNKCMLLYRPYDMSTLVGSAYRGIVSTYLYSGIKKYSMEYEYGFIYGGLFVLGYCNYIHEYAQNHGIDKVLFLSRDGDILKQIYDKLYQEDKTEYVYWSRKAATKLEAYYDKNDYFRRFIYHKVNQNYSIKDILKSMELEFLTDELGEWRDIWPALERKQEEECKYKYKKSKYIELCPEDELDDKNGYSLCKFIEVKWNKVVDAYSNQMEATKKYYQNVIGDCKRCVAVDIGWAGSGAMNLRYLVKNEWKIDCELTGIVAGTNTVHNAEPNTAECFLQSGQLVAYLYSQSHNRDLLKKHDPNKDYNVFWELLLASPTLQFTGFYSGNHVAEFDSSKTEGDNGKAEYIEGLDITLKFGKLDYNIEGIKEIQRGIHDFVDEYHSRFGRLPYMERISGRDAYAPMIVAASYNEKYLKCIEKKFKLEINVN